MITDTDIVSKALVRVGVKSIGDAVDSATQSTASEALESLHATLQREPVLDWELDSIPPEAVQSLVDELAWELRNDFDVPTEKLISLQAAQANARRNLQLQYQIPQGADPVPIESF